MGVHAFMSPSTADRTLKCPLSAILSFRVSQRIELFREVGAEFFGLHDDPEAHERINVILEEDNQMADEGTALHEVFEKCIPLKKISKSIVVKMIRKSPDVTQATKDDPYVLEGVIRAIREERKLLKTMEHYELEKKIKVQGLPQFGYADVIALNDRILYIRDLKTGRNEVSAEENWQLMTYAVGVLDEWGWDNFDKVEIGIIGTRFASNEWTTTPEHLLKFKREVMLPAFMEAHSLNPRASTGKHCIYCQGKIACAAWQKEFSDKMNETFDNEDVTDNTNEELVDLFRLCKQAERLAKADLGPEIMLQFDGFNPPKNITRVSSGTLEKWNDDQDTVAKKLSKKVKNKNLLYKQSLMTPKQLRALNIEVSDDLTTTIQKKPWLKI